MAIAYQSTQTATATAGTNITVTKPTSLASGDLMVGGVTNAGLGGVGLPAGWTTIANFSGYNSTIVGWKIADASDVAASNFTFTGASGFERCAFISRYTGTSTTAPVDQSITNNANGTSFSVAGFTPTYANSFFVVLAPHRQDGAGGPHTASGWAIATNNPTWTTDFNLTNGAVSATRVGFSGAHASRPQTTASGNISANMSGSSFIDVIAFNIIEPVASTSRGFFALM